MERKFDRLCDFQRQHGHCRVPKRFMVELVRLGMWVSKQIQLYKDFRNGKTSRSISDERIAELNAIGFEWTINPLVIRTGIWQDKFERLCDFQREYGHCRVPFGFVVDSVNIGMWVNSDTVKVQLVSWLSRVNWGAGPTETIYEIREWQQPASIANERTAKVNVIDFEWKLIEHWFME